MYSKRSNFYSHKTLAFCEFVQDNHLLWVHCFQLQQIVTKADMVIDLDAPTKTIVL
jgi:hypothetical protein